MTRESQQWEAELVAANWRPFEKHPNATFWFAPDGLLYPGPGYAHSVMKQMAADDIEREHKELK